jgi:hypothetical protein
VGLLLGAAGRDTAVRGEETANVLNSIGNQGNGIIVADFDTRRSLASTIRVSG